MGFGTIVGGGTDGRYTIEIDSGEWLRVQILAQASAAIADLEGRLIVAQAALVDAEAKEEEARLQAAADMQAYIDNIKPSLLPLPDSNEISFAKLRLVELQKQHQSLRTLIDAIKFDLAEARKVAARMNTLQAKEIRQAWCADFTEDRAPGSQVGTIEIPGEPKLVLVAPGARGWMPTDGFLLARELHRPDQAYLNGALLPGALKWKPTYRWGTCTAKDDDANTMTVVLAPATAGGQSLNVNRQTTLSGVPVSYMTCNSLAFDVGDRVVVQFAGQSWDSPTVVGFVDNPKPCVPWPDVLLDFTPLGIEIVTPFGSGSDMWASGIFEGECGSIMGFVESKPRSAVARRFTRYENWRFDDEDAEDDGFSIEVAGTTYQDWGLDNFNSFGAGGPDVSRPASSPAHSILLDGSTVKRRVRPFAEYTRNVYSTIDDVSCVVTGNRTGNFFSLSNFDEGYIAAELRYTEEILGTVPEITVSVTKGPTTRVYEMKASVGSGTLTLRYGAPTTP